MSLKYLFFSGPKRVHHVPGDPTHHSSHFQSGWVILLAVFSVGIFEQSMGAIGTEQDRVVVPARQATLAGGIDFLGLLKSWKIRAKQSCNFGFMESRTRSKLFGESGPGSRPRLFWKKSQFKTFLKKIPSSEGENIQLIKTRKVQNFSVFFLGGGGDIQ